MGLTASLCGLAINLCALLRALFLLVLLFFQFLSSSQELFLITIIIIYRMFRRYWAKLVRIGNTFFNHRQPYQTRFNNVRAVYGIGLGRIKCRVYF